MAEQIANLQSECGLSTSVQEFKEQYRFGLVEAVFEWARGMPFSEITNLTDVQEGRVYVQSLMYGAIIVILLGTGSVVAKVCVEHKHPGAISTKGWTIIFFFGWGGGGGGQLAKKFMYSTNF